MEKRDNTEIIEAIQDLATQVDERFNQVDERFNQVDERFNQVDERFNQVNQRIDEVREDLTGQLGKLRSDTIDHVSRTVGEAKGDIVQMLKTDRERHKLFHEKMLSIMERNKLARPEEIQALKELAV